MMIFSMIEVFFRFHIEREMPKKKVSDNPTELMESFTKDSFSPFLRFFTSRDIINSLLESFIISRFLAKLGILPEEIQTQEVGKELLSKTAFEVSKTRDGMYVTPMDIFAAYLFLTEEKTKLLFTRRIKKEDVFILLRWLLAENPSIEKKSPVRIHFAGAGIGEGIISGWTPETKKYTFNFTLDSLKEIPLIDGREKEFNEMVESLQKMENNNILLVGDHGSGKETLVRALASKSFSSELPDEISHKRIFQFLTGAFIAGAGNRSEVEERLQFVIAEISHAINVILYIDGFENLMGATSYNLDLSGALLPYLKTGKLPIIATMTAGSYKAYMQRHPLKEVFTVIQLPEPDKKTVLLMTLRDAQKIEDTYTVLLTYTAITKAIDLATRFFQDEVLPGSAVALLENVANKVSLSTSPLFGKTKRKLVTDVEVEARVQEQTHVPLSKPTKEEADILLHLEDKLHERIIDQQEAVKAISEAIRRVRSGMTQGRRPISFLFLGPTGVGKTETAKALADLYYGGEKTMLRFDMSEYSDQTGLKRLLGAPPGEGTERGELTDKIHDNPSSLVLLDEFEKANSAIHNLFLQVLDDGRLTDNKGQTVSFSNAIVIATSNAGSELIREEVSKGIPIDRIFQQKLLDFIETKAIFKPELLNRFDGVIIFKPLSADAVSAVVTLLIENLIKTLKEQDITLVVEDAVIEKIASEGADEAFGARPLRRYIQEHLEDEIAKKKLTDEITRGKTATVSLNEKGELFLTIS